MMKPVLLNSETNMQSESDNNDSQKMSSDQSDHRVVVTNKLSADQSDQSDRSDRSDQSDRSDRSDYSTATRKDRKKTNDCVPETLDTIIKNLDNCADIKNQSKSPQMLGESNTHMLDMSDYVTKERFSSLIGDMRVDMLALVKLVDSMRKNETNISEEIRNLKKDMSKLVTENAQLKERMNRLKVDGDNKYQSLSQMVTTRFDELAQKSGHPTSDTTQQTFGDLNTQSIKVVRRSSNDVVDNTAPSKSVQVDKTELGEVEKQNVFTDSNMDKRASKFKVVPPRSKKMGYDTFENKKGEIFNKIGKAEKEDEEDIMIIDTTRQVIRKDTYDSNEKKNKSSKSVRAKRLGLS
jgi:hypothetical protein